MSDKNRIDVTLDFDGKKVNIDVTDEFEKALKKRLAMIDGDTIEQKYTKNLLEKPHIKTPKRRISEAIVDALTSLGDRDEKNVKKGEK
ncbi:MAG: hypothetical protein LBQ52_04560 [Helicobacteraceae bacterium]|jgi:hypothetical protein|nr:hypothetical protein [Helicobacteraceae bacterium]